MTEDETPPTTWLDAAFVVSVLGSAGADLEQDVLEEQCAGVRSYVEGKRTDLIVTVFDDDGAVVSATFTPTGAVRLGAAMLAHRFYHRRLTPLGVLGFTEDGAAGIMQADPDVAMLLGIGKRGRFVFGGAAAAS